VKKVSGSRTYPVAYAYDAQGRMTEMTTWQDFDGETGQTSPTTSWEYHPQRGWLSKKSDPDQNEITYTYDTLGRLETRTWERGLVTTYGYTTAGELKSITYSDQTTPDVEIVYDRRGLRESVTEELDETIVTARTFEYADHWQLEAESWTEGPLTGFTMKREYNDPAKRLTSVQFLEGASVLVSQEVDYKPGTPHIESVSDLTVPATPVRAEFSIEPNSRMISKTEFYQDQTLRLEVERQRDALDRLGYIGSSAASFTYDYNAANQRSQVTTEDDYYWNWGYDDLGQLETAKRHRPNGLTVLGHDFAFTHDTIGNRTQAVRNGTPSSYTPNLLNQYEEREVPGLIHILGTAEPEATITVDQEPTLRQDALFYKELEVDNVSPGGGQTGSVYETLTVRGVKIDDGPPPVNYISDSEREVFVPETPEEFDYDDDGNLTQDGRWDYVWNAENRLVRMETRSDLVATLPRQRLDFTYDADGRRIRKEVSDWDDGSSQFQPTSATRYIYNEWNLLAEIDDTGSVVRSYLWGPSEHGQIELTATPGALLGLRDHTDNDAFYFAQADGNGNIAILIAATDGTEAARYEYGPFGEPLRATGPMAQKNPLRFSSKLVDTETGLYYYGYRYYSPSMGRWLNRDPIEEQGSMFVRGDREKNMKEESNLYRFVMNNPLSNFDVLGLASSGFSCSLKKPITLVCCMATFLPGGRAAVKGSYCGDLGCKRACNLYCEENFSSPEECNKSCGRRAASCFLKACRKVSF
jgi:RHS repeat-associated protein